MVAHLERLSVTCQYELLALLRSTFYHLPKPVSEKELELVKLLDRCHLEHSYYGSRRIWDWLEYQVNRKRIQQLMRTMGLVVPYPKRNFSLANQRISSIRICSGD